MDGGGNATAGEAEGKGEVGRARLFGQLAYFFVPLAIQGFSMSLTYPLVGSVVSHGRFGAAEYAVLAQAQTIMFLVGSVGAGLITTGMIFGTTRRGFRNFRLLSLSLGLAAIALQALCCLPPFDDFIFGRLYGLDGELKSLAKTILLWSIPMNYSFFARNTGLATLFRVKRTDTATLATAIRIGGTWIGSILFVRAGLVGWKWGLALSSSMVILETALLNIMSVPYWRRLSDDDGSDKNQSVASQYAFTIPLSLGGTMMCLAGVMIPVFLAKLPAAATARNIHYIIFGILNPLHVAALKMQSVVVAFPPKDHPRGSIFSFAIAAGVSLAALAMLLTIPGVSKWYFGSIQNLAADEVGLARKAMLLIAFLPMISALKSFAEGQAALIMRPNAILSSQIAFLATLVLSFFLFVQTSALPSFIVSSVVIMLSHAFALIVLRIALMSNRIADKYGVANPRRHDGRVSP